MRSLPELGTRPGLGSSRATASPGRHANRDQDWACAPSGPGRHDGDRGLAPEDEDVAPARQVPEVTRANAREFERVLQAHLAGLRLHCYRMLGSLDDAEDVTQETLVRAWRRWHQLVRREAPRPWLYRIATNACLDLIETRRRYPAVTPLPFRESPDPLPDAWLDSLVDRDVPLDRLVRKETVALAFIAAVQFLPARQRAVVLLSDVLEWSAREIAEALETTPVAVNSALQRGRAAIRLRLPAGWSEYVNPSIPDEGAWMVAERYLAAWERQDVAALAELLRDDARMAMPPDLRAFSDRDAILRFFAEVFSRPPSERIRLQPTRANLQPAFIVHIGPSRPQAMPIGVKVLTVRDGTIARIDGFMRMDLAERFSELPS